MKKGIIGIMFVFGIFLSLNFVTGKAGDAAAVLIRAVEPLNFEGKGNGSGLLTQSLGIDKSFHKKHVLNDRGYVDLVGGWNEF